MATFTLPASIPADGSAECTAALADWINSASGTPDNWNTIQFPAFGEFWSDATLTLTFNCLRVRGAGSTLLRRLQRGGDLDARHARGLRHVRFLRCADFEVRHLYVEGSADPTVGYDSSLEAQHGFEFASSARGVLSDLDANDVWGDKFYLGNSGSGTPWSDSLSFNGCGNAGHLCHRDPVAITGASNVAFDDCNFGVYCRTGVDIEPNSASGGAREVSFTDCTWGMGHLNWVSAASAAGDVTGMSFVRCDVAGSLRLVCDGGGRRADWTVDSCTGHVGYGGPQGCAMWFAGLDGELVVTNNHQGLQQRRPPPPMRVARWDEYTAANATITYEGNTKDVG